MLGHHTRPSPENKENFVAFDLGRMQNQQESKENISKIKVEAPPN